MIDVLYVCLYIDIPASAPKKVFDQICDKHTYLLYVHFAYK